MTRLHPEDLAVLADAVERAVADRPRLVNADQAAAALGVPASWLLAEARVDRIPHVRLGRYVRFDPDALAEWTTERQRGPRVRKENAA